jgi:hypothetical protein
MTLKSKLLAIALLAGGSVFAGPRVAVGIGVGVGYPYGYYAPPPAPVVTYAAPYPGPGYWVGGYYPAGVRYGWRGGYYGARWNAPAYYGHRYYGGRWGRGYRR